MFNRFFKFGKKFNNYARNIKINSNVIKRPIVLASSGLIMTQNYAKSNSTANDITDINTLKTYITRNGISENFIECHLDILINSIFNNDIKTYEYIINYIDKIFISGSYDYITQHREELESILDALLRTSNTRMFEIFMDKISYKIFHHDKFIATLNINNFPLYQLINQDHHHCINIFNTLNKKPIEICKLYDDKRFMIMCLALEYNKIDVFKVYMKDIYFNYETNGSNHYIIKKLINTNNVTLLSYYLENTSKSFERSHLNLIFTPNLTIEGWRTISLFARKHKFNKIIIDKFVFQPNYIIDKFLDIFVDINNEDSDTLDYLHLSLAYNNKKRFCSREIIL